MTLKTDSDTIHVPAATVDRIETPNAKYAKWVGLGWGAHSVTLWLIIVIYLRRAHAQLEFQWGAMKIPAVGVLHTPSHPRVTLR